MATELPLIVIVGPTASGKTGLAIELAERFGGEIICADSRTIYREMNIGTAKPTADERARVPHWGLDIVGPNERYNAAAFQTHAKRKISEIRARGNVPFLVGGTGLYVDAVIYDYNFPAPPTEADRALIQSMNIDQLTKYCIENNIELPPEDKNIRRLQKAALTNNSEATRQKNVIENCFVVGIATKKDILEQRIIERTEHMFADGVVDEAKKLGEKYGWNSEAMTSNVYQSIKPYLDGDCSLGDVMTRFVIRDRQLAKRQMTWFRRNDQIHWHSLENAEQFVASKLGV